MKFARKITLFTVIALAVTAVSGCSGLLGWILPLSIQERVAAFTLAINDDDRDPNTILLNFGPSSEMTEYNKAKEDSYWEAAFPAENDYVFVIYDDSDTEAVIVKATITTSSGTLTETYLFKMHEEASGNWLINAIYEDPDGTNEMLIKKVQF